MRATIDDIIRSIEDNYSDNLSADARHYLEINIGKEAAKKGLFDLAEEFKNAHAIVPLRQALPGMKVRIDGRTFVKYRQFASGIAVPGYVAKGTMLSQKPYTPNDSMILNFT